MTEQVQATAIDAVVSKESSMARGYFKDDFLQFFVPPQARKRRSPIINRGYYARFAAFDAVVRNFVGMKHLKGKQIVSLGGGSETTYFRLKKAGLINTGDEEDVVHYVEIDMAETAAHKAEIVQRNPELSSLLSPDTRYSTGGSPTPGVESHLYRVIAHDLAEPDATRLENKLLFSQSTQGEGSRTMFDFARPTLFISECVLVYMDPPDSNRLISWCASRFSGPCGFVIYEQIRPFDAFGEMMMQNLRKRGCALRSVSPTLLDQERRFVERGGWDACRAVDMKNVYYDVVDKEERLKNEKLEIFDEFEEFFLMMQHYSFAVAVKGEALTVERLYPELARAPPSEDRGR